MCYSFCVLCHRRLCVKRLFIFGLLLATVFGVGLTMLRFVYGFAEQTFHPILFSFPQLGAAAGIARVVESLLYLGACIFLLGAAGSFAQKAFKSFRSIPVIGTVVQIVLDMMEKLDRTQDILYRGQAFVRIKDFPAPPHSVIGIMVGVQNWDYGEATGENVCVFVPAPPIPFTGQIIFTKMEKIEIMEMRPDVFSTIFFTLGLMRPQLVKIKQKTSSSYEKLDVAKKER